MPLLGASFAPVHQCPPPLGPEAGVNNVTLSGVTTPLELYSILLRDPRGNPLCRQPSHPEQNS